MKNPRIRIRFEGLSHVMSDAPSDSVRGTMKYEDFLTFVDTLYLYIEGEKDQLEWPLHKIRLISHRPKKSL